MSTPVIMVRMDDHTWTANAMRAACLEARRLGGRVALALMLPKTQTTLAGITPERYEFTPTEQEELAVYRAIASEIGVEMSVHVFEYETLERGVVDAADALSAEIVYIHLPPSLLPFQHELQVRHLEKALEEHQHHLRDFDSPVIIGE